MSAGSEGSQVDTQAASWFYQQIWLESTAVLQWKCVQNSLSCTPSPTTSYTTSFGITH